MSAHPRSSARRRRSAAAGFTLIEALVVLMLVGLVAAVATESLTRVFDLRTRLAAYLDSAASSRMTLNWLRRSVAGLMPDFIDGEERFRGSAAEFSGISLTAPGSDIGVPKRVAWRLAPNTSIRGVNLETKISDGPWIAVAAWPDRSGRFGYDGGDGQWVAEWPPAMAPPTTPQIPRYIRVEVGDRANNWSAILSSDGPRQGKQRTGDFLRSTLSQ